MQRVNFKLKNFLELGLQIDNANINRDVALKQFNVNQKNAFAEFNARMKDQGKNSMLT